VAAGSASNQAGAGYTEGSVELAILAGLQPSSVLCELMNEDGTMMRGEAIERFARERGYPILTIAELIQWRTRQQQKAA
jgi:3,4-dihydroxy 2-butanone 4-phosphate synthase